MDIIEPGSLGLAILLGLTFAGAILSLWGAGLGHQKWLFLAFLGVLIFLPDQTSWGARAADDIFNVYSRGTGQFFFSITTLYLWLVFVIAWFPYVFRGVSLPYCNIRPMLVAFGVLFLAHALVAAFTNRPLDQALSGFGVFNIVNMSFLLVLATLAIRDERDLQQLIDFVLVCALLRGVYGLIRFAFFGGDPVNVYANVQKMDVAITFYDITDSMVACVAAFYSAARLRTDWRSEKVSYRMLLLANVIIGVAIIVLSARRNAWAGLGLAGLWYAYFEPGRRRLYVIGGLAALVPVFAIVSALRFKGAGGDMIDNIFGDILGGGSVTVYTGRFAELYQAWQTIEDNWLLGIGTWAEFAGYGIDFHEGFYGFVHSGVLHVFMKTGVVGLALFLAILAGFAWFVVKKRADVSDSHKPFFDAGMAGFLFLIPSLAVATPVIEYRTMLVYGFVLAIPYIAYAVQSTARRGVVAN